MNLGRRKRIFKNTAAKQKDLALDIMFTIFWHLPLSRAN